MASAFGHAYAAIAIRSGYKDYRESTKVLWAGIFCAIFPDADVISFKFGIAYEDFWGHRGFSHSILFAIGMGLLFGFIFNIGKLKTSLTYIKLSTYFFLCTVSHGLLDGMTNGGKGVAYFSPWDNERYFLPWRPINVSPLSASSFFSEWGLQVIISEIIWIGIPCTIWILIMKFVNKNNE